MKLCVDCVHHLPDLTFSSEELQNKCGYCAKSEVASPVDGSINRQLCGVMRLETGGCREEAKLYEPCHD